MAVPADILNLVGNTLMADGLKIAVLVVTARFLVFGMQRLRASTPRQKKPFDWSTASERAKRRRYRGG